MNEETIDHENNLDKHIDRLHEQISFLLDKRMMDTITSEILRMVIFDFLEDQNDAKKQILLNFLHQIEQGDSLDKLDKVNYSPEFIKFRDEHCPGICLNDIRIVVRLLCEKMESEGELERRGVTKSGSACINEFFSQLKKKGYAYFDEFFSTSSDLASKYK